MWIDLPTKNPVHWALPNLQCKHPLNTPEVYYVLFEKAISSSGLHYCVNETCLKEKKVPYPVPRRGYHPAHQYYFAHLVAPPPSSIHKSINQRIPTSFNSSTQLFLLVPCSRKPPSRRQKRASPCSGLYSRCWPFTFLGPSRIAHDSSSRQWAPSPALSCPFRLSVFREPSTFYSFDVFPCSHSS